MCYPCFCLLTHSLASSQRVTMKCDAVCSHPPTPLLSHLMATSVCASLSCLIVSVCALVSLLLCTHSWEQQGCNSVRRYLLYSTDTPHPARLNTADSVQNVPFCVCVLVRWSRGLSFFLFFLVHFILLFSLSLSSVGVDERAFFPFLPSFFLFLTHKKW